MVEFRGIDVVIERVASDDEIKTALASALSVSQERVAVIDDVAKYPEVSAADVVCVVSPTRGGFASILSIDATCITLPGEDNFGPAQGIAENLRTRCLIPDDGPNPYVMWLISLNQSPRQVSLDVAALDEDRYVIAPDQFAQ